MLHIYTVGDFPESIWLYTSVTTESDSFADLSVAQLLNKYVEFVDLSGNKTIIFRKTIHRVAASISYFLAITSRQNRLRKRFCMGHH